MIIIIVAAFRISKLDSVYFDEDPKKIEISWTIIIIALLLLITIRISLFNEFLLNWTE